MAGKEGERLSGFDYGEEGAATDAALTRLYAATICMSADAVVAFLDYCKIESRELLKTHWPSVEAVALALDEKKTLDGAEVEALIYHAEAEVAQQAERQRRQRMVDMAKNAQRFQNGQWTGVTLSNRLGSGLVSLGRPTAS